MRSPSLWSVARVPKARPRRAVLAFVLLALPVALLPAAAVPAPSADVAWLADTLGLEVTDLPASMEMQHFRAAEGTVTWWTTDTPLDEVATFIRSSASERAPPPIPPIPPNPPTFLGAGVRSAAAATNGVKWSGFAYGNNAMACMTISATPTGVTVPPNPVNGGGPLQVMVSAQLPVANTFIRIGTATMDVQVLPLPGVDAAVSTPGAESAVLVGEGSSICRLVFAIRLTAGSYAGDGTIHG